FCDQNAARRGAVTSISPEMLQMIRFDVVKAKNQFAVHHSLKRYYQAEVLVPSPVPPHLIVFPNSDGGETKRRHGSVPVAAAPLVSSQSSESKFDDNSPACAHQDMSLPASIVSRA